MFGFPYFQQAYKKFKLNLFFFNVVCLLLRNIAIKSVTFRETCGFVSSL